MLIGYQQMKRCRRSGKFLRLSLDGSCNSEEIAFQPKQSKNYPAEARKLVRPAFVWSDYCWKEAGEIVERFIEGFVMSIKKLEDGRYLLDIRPNGRKGKRVRKVFDKNR